MSNLSHIHFVVLGALLGLGGCATPGAGFPSDAQPIAAQALHERLASRAFTARVAGGATWEIRYEANGRMQMTVSNGMADAGRWRTEDNRLCVDFDGKFPSGCSEVRADAKQLYLKRASNGEIVALTPKP